MRRFYLYQVLENKDIEELNPSESRNFLRKVNVWFNNVKQEISSHLVISDLNKYFFIYHEGKYYIIDDYLKVYDWEIKNLSRNYIRFLGKFKDLLGNDFLKNLMKNDFCVCYVWKKGEKVVHDYLKITYENLPT